MYYFSSKHAALLFPELFVLALEKSGWKVAGKGSAATILGIPISTLNSKIKAFGIEMHSN